MSFHTPQTHELYDFRPRCLTVSPCVIFSTLFFVFCPCVPLLLPSSLVNSWVDVPAREATPQLFLLLLSFPPPLPPFLPPCPVPCRGIGGISLPGSSWGRLHLSQGFPPERAFFTSGDLLTAYGDIECLIALPPNFTFLFFSGSLNCWTWCTLGLRC